MEDREECCTFRPKSVCVQEKHEDVTHLEVLQQAPLQFAEVLHPFSYWSPSRLALEERSSGL